MAPSLYASCLKASANIGCFFLLCKFFAKKNSSEAKFTLPVLTNLIYHNKIHRANRLFSRFFCTLSKICIAMDRTFGFPYKKSLVAVLVSIILSFTSVSCASVRPHTQPKHSNKYAYRSVSVEKFSAILQRGDVVLVDVRTPEEYGEGHLEGVDYNLNVRSATFFKDYQSLPKEKLIAIYCKGGGRSKQVAGVLAGNGYKVVELAVGYDGWVKAGGKTEK